MSVDPPGRGYVKFWRRIRPSARGNGQVGEHGKDEVVTNCNASRPRNAFCDHLAG